MELQEKKNPLKTLTKQSFEKDDIIPFGEKGLMSGFKDSSVIYKWILNTH